MSDRYGPDVLARNPNAKKRSTEQPAEKGLVATAYVAWPLFSGQASADVLSPAQASKIRRANTNLVHRRQTVRMRASRGVRALTTKRRWFCVGAA